jgi:hypothetical protein
MPWQASPLRGEALTVHLRETGYVVQLLNDVRRFVLNWRYPRSELAWQQRERLFREWERLGQEGGG